MTKTDLESLRSVLLRGQEVGVAAITGPECAHLYDLLEINEELTKTVSEFATIIALSDDEGVFVESLLRIIQNAMSTDRAEVQYVLHRAQIAWADVPVKDSYG